MNLGLLWKSKSWEMLEPRFKPAAPGLGSGAPFLRVSRRSIYKFIEEEDLPAYRLTATGPYRFFPQELEAWLKREKPEKKREVGVKKKNRPKKSGKTSKGRSK